MRPLRRMGPCLLISAGFLWTGPVPAEEPPRAAAGRADVRAGAHMQRGRAARDAGKCKEAEAAFRAALVAGGPAPLTPAMRAEIIGEIGLCELRQDKFRDGAQHIEESLSLGRGSLSAPLQRRLEEGQRSAERHIARVYLSVVPSDAEVLIDGKVIPQRQAAHELFLDPGPHTLRARMDDYDDSEVSFQVAAGDAPPLRVVLARARSRTAPPVVRPRPAPWDRAAPVKREHASDSAWRTAGIVASAATAAIGIAALIGEEVVNDTVKEKSTAIKERSGPLACRGADRVERCDQLADAEHGRVALSWIGVSSLVASGVIAGLTVRSFLSSPEPPTRKTGIQIVPVAGPTSGVLVHGSF